MPRLRSSHAFYLIGVLTICVTLAGCNVLGSNNRPSVNSAPAATVGPAILETSTSAPAAAAGPATVEAPIATGAAGQPTTVPAGVTPAPSIAPPAPAVTSTASVTSTATDRNATALAAQAAIPARDIRELAMRLKPGVGDIAVVVKTTAPSHKVGDQERFWVGNEDTQEHRQITATLKYVTPHVYMWVENGVNLDQAGLEKSANLFENKTYPTDREFFGSEWSPGVDDDVHLSILHARNLGQSIAGAYSAADEYSHLANPYSNEKEMFYISADSQGAKPGTDFYDGVLAHEFQHMIHWAHDRNEESWVNEGLSELAAHLNGFDVGGFDMAYVAQPDTQLDTWSDPTKGNANHYGASYLFMKYFLDRFGAELTKAVVANSENGISGFNDALAKAGRPERFDDIYADWLVANDVNQPQAAPQGRYGYSGINPDPPVLAKTYQSYPAQDQAQVSQYGADFYGLASGGDLTVDFKGQTTVPVVNARAAGKYAWWSNRGDDDDATLTRAVDLTKVPTATLTFSAWYDIEDGYDYGYVEASTDGGKHWQILPGQHTTNKDKSGNAYGPGWTGISGGGATPQWVQERVDLTPFAGKQIQLRFEYVTDDAVNGPGFLMDNIAIPEIGFKDGGESGANGWQAAGWVLTDNTLDQRWLVQLVGAGSDGIHVQRMVVGADGHGTATLPGTDNYDNVELIVSGLTPVTTEPASYSFTVARGRSAAPAPTQAPASTVAPAPPSPTEPPSSTSPQPAPTTIAGSPPATPPAHGADTSSATGGLKLGATAPAPGAIPTYTYKVLQAFSHDPEAWTEGLVYQDGDLYESTGTEGKSSVRKVDLATGKVLQRYDLPPQYYGEGIALYGDKIAGLTWKNQAGFVYDRATLQPTGQFTYPGEGWGMTYDGQNLIMSDGTDALRFLDPGTFVESHRVHVSSDGVPVMQINELEYIDGAVYANIWQTDRIARIDPASGQVTAWIDLTGLLPPADRTGQVDVLNGIAYDAQGKRLFVTGKLWPKLFQIELVPR